MVGARIRNTRLSRSALTDIFEITLEALPSLMRRTSDLNFVKRGLQGCEKGAKSPNKRVGIATPWASIDFDVFWLIL